VLNAAAAVDDPDGSPPLGQATAFTLGTLLLGGVAVACIVATHHRGLVLSLGGLGLLVGLAAVPLAWLAGQSRLWPAAGAALCGTALVTAGLFPGLFGPVSSSPDGSDLAALRVVPLSGHEVDPDAEKAEWLDASRYALQQKDIGVQVVSAMLGPVEVQGTNGKKRFTSEKYLIIRVRAQRVYGGRKVLAERGDAPGASVDSPPVTLRDETGKVYPRAAVNPVEPSEGLARKPFNSPGSVIEEVYAFEAPPAAVKSLRLEVRTAAWGGSTPFRFAIPGSMIRTPQAKNARTNR